MKNALNKAVKLHKVHMKKPTTATEKSQEALMRLMQKHKQEMGTKKAPMKRR